MTSARWPLPENIFFLSKLGLRSKTIAIESSIFAKLPPELILRIALYLPPASAGAFSLCNKSLYATLANPYLKCQRGHSPFNTVELLRLLEPDLPDHIVCYNCEKLHEMKRPERHIKYDKRCDIIVNESMRRYVHPRFSYVIFQMAMKRHRQELDYSSLLELLSYSESSIYSSNEIKTSSRIIDGSLLLRQQNIFIVHPNNEYKIAYANITICPHAGQLRGKMDYYTNAPEKYIMEYTHDRVDVDRTSTGAKCGACDSCGSCMHQGRKGEGIWSGLVRCRDCATEFRVDTVGIGKRGKAFVVTRWKDLGEGRDAADPVWRAHLGEKGVWRKAAGGRSICERFEGEGWRGGIESLTTPKEMKRLVKYRYFFCEV